MKRLGFAAQALTLIGVLTLAYMPLGFTQTGKSNVSEEKVRRAVQGLSSAEIRLLTEPSSFGTATQERTLQTYTLHAQQKRTCWYVRAKHEYEAWVEVNGQRTTVDQIELRINRGRDVPAGYVHTCANASWCPKTDDVTYTGNACGRSILRACARVGGLNWCTNDSVLD